MKLSEIAINTVNKHPLQRQFNIEAWCVKEQYWSYLKKYDTGQFRKIIIGVCDSVSKDFIKISWTHINVLDIDTYLDIQHFVNQNKAERKIILLELLHANMLIAADAYLWEIEPLNNAYQQCKLAQLEHVFRVKNKTFRSPTREFLAYVECHWDTDAFRAKTVILNKHQDVVKEQALMEIEPYFGEFVYYCTCKWESNTSFSLIAKDGKKWTTNLLALI